MKSIPGELQCVVDQRFASLDLGDQVSRDASKLVGFGNYGVVYEGTLRPAQTQVAIKAVRYGDKSALPVLKAGSLFAFVSTMSHDSILESAYTKMSSNYNCIRSYDIHSITIDVQGKRV